MFVLRCDPDLFIFGGGNATVNLPFILKGYKYINLIMRPVALHLPLTECCLYVLQTAYFIYRLELIATD